jgi:hypothetical protein
MALPTVRYSERLPPMKTSIPGVYGVNSAHILKGNLNVNETIQIAEDAIEGVLKPALTSRSILSQRNELSNEPVLAGHNNRAE